MVSDRSVYVRVKGDVSDYVQALMSGAAATKAFTKELDTSTDRSTMLTQSLLAIGPALVPITAAAIPAVSGLTNQMAFAAAGVGVAALAFQGFGDALKATNEYAIDPTDANLQKMRQTMSELGPAGREFVTFLQDIRPQLQGLQDAAQGGLFPGAQSGIDDLMSRLPQVERIIGVIADAGGDMLAEAGQNLASPEWDEFFNFLESEARPALVDFSRSLGNLAEGFANLWMAFDPLSDSFSAGFLQMSRDFAAWTDGLSETEGFQEFLDYIERTGPQVWETLGALGNALLQVVEAAAPVGEVALPAIEAIADVLAAVANSDAGPILIGAAAGISAISRALSLFNAANGSALSGLLSGSMLGGGRSAFKDAATATTELRIAQDRLAQSARSAQTAQFALIPTADKRRAIADYTVQSKAMAEAEKQAGAATRARNMQMGQLAAGAGLLAFSMSDLDEKMGLSNTATLAMMGSLVGPWGAAVGGGVGLAMDLASANDEAAASFDRARNAIDNNVGTIEEQTAALAEAKEAAEGGWDFTDQFEAAIFTDAASAIDENARAAQDLRFQEAGLADAMSSTNEVARNATDVLLALIDTRNAAAEQALTARDAERAYEAAIDDAAASIKENGRTLDDSTPKGRANAEALDGIAAAWNNLDEAGRKAKGGIGAARREFINAATNAGMAKGEARELANQLLKIEPPKPIQVSMPGIQGGIDAAATLANQLSRLHDKTITITTIRKGAKGGGDVGLGINSADGNIFAAYANGGFEDHVAQIAPGNVTRIWAEPETGGEAYIPLAPAKRARSRNIAEQTIGILGGQVEWFANGGINGRYDTFSDLTHSSRLDIERQKLRIQDIAESLREKETYGRGKNKKKRPALRGRAKTVAELELREAKAELAKMLRENRELKNYGSKDYEENLRDDTERAADEAKKAEDEAAQRIADAATEFASQKKSSAQIFNLMSGGSAAAVDRNLARTLANAGTFLGLLGDLKSKGASPWLLEQFVAAGPTPGAIKLAREYTTNQAAFNNVQARASQIDQYTNQYAGLVGSANFMNPAAWNSGVTAGPQVKTPIQITVNPSQGMSETNLANIVGGQLAWRLN